MEDYEDPEFFIEEFEEESEEAPSPQEEQTNGQTTQDQENVFYAGSRRRDS